MTVKSAYKNGQFCWVDLVAHDMAAAQDFYGKLFGWTHNALDTQDGPPYAQFEMNGQGVAGIGQMNEEMKSQGIPPMWNSYISVEDIEAVVKKAQQHGGTITVPVMKVTEAGMLAFVQDPTGGNVGLWQPIHHFGAVLVNEPVSFCWNELATRDIERARSFFHDVLEWDFEEYNETPNKYYMIKNQGEMNGGLLQMTEEWGDIPPCWAVYFAVEDADATAQKAQQLGGAINVPAFDIPVGRMAVLADPQGAVFSIIKLNN